MESYRNFVQLYWYFKGICKIRSFRKIQADLKRLSRGFVIFQIYSQNL